MSSFKLNELTWNIKIEYLLLAKKYLFYIAVIIKYLTFFSF